MAKANSLTPARPAMRAALLVLTLTTCAGLARSGGVPEVRPDDRCVSIESAPTPAALDPRARMNLLGLRRSDQRSGQFGAAAEVVVRVRGDHPVK